MSRSDRDKLEAEREARRARRLSDRAEQRARRKAEQAQRAADRAEELAFKAKRSPRHRDRSIEDVVDDVTEKWSRKAEDWMGHQSRELFGQSSWDSSGGRTDYSTSDDMMDDGFDEDDDHETSRGRREASARRKAKRRERMKLRKTRLREEFGLERERKRLKRRNRNGNLYKDGQNKKVFGVCSGVADYWGMETWQVRFMAIVGLFVVPSVAVPGYFIAAFLMDNKPYYKKVTDRFHELDEDTYEQRDPEVKRKRSKPSREESKAAKTMALREAKQKFADIEDRLRVMETHVTSPKFELQRELRKIAGDEA